MKQLNLREANQEFSRLVRKIEETGERVLVLRNGKPHASVLLPLQIHSGGISSRRTLG